MLKNIIVTPAPHISSPFTTRRVMIDVLIGLSPAIIAAGIYFHKYALILFATCVLSCLATEWLFNIIRKKPNSIEDCSAGVTGIILAMSLPPAIPYWAAIIGCVFAIAIGKMIFGGLGANIFNPAMIGRTFLTASFGMLMTTWTIPSTINTSLPQMSPANLTDAGTQATPLGWSKQAIKNKNIKEDAEKVLAQYENNSYKPAEYVNNQIKNLFLGSTGGCLGETSKIALIIGGIYLLIRKTITWHIPVAVLVSAAAFGSIAYFIDKTAYISPLTQLSSGGLILCAFFIATDPVTAPLTNKGMLIFGIGVGLLTMLIRIVGEYPEGVMYAVLLMNSVTPIIDRYCKIIPAGGIPNVK